MQPESKRLRFDRCHDTSLSELISAPRVDWNAVMKKLASSDPSEEPKKGIIIAAVCNELSPVPPEVLLTLLVHIPLKESDETLGYAFSNPRILPEVLKILLELERPDLQEVDALMLCAIDEDNRIAIKTLLMYAPELLSMRDNHCNNLFMHYVCSTSGFTDAIRYLLEEANRCNIGSPTYFCGLFSINAYSVSPLHLLCEDGRNFSGLVDFFLEECKFLLRNQDIATLLISSAARLNEFESAEKIVQQFPPCIERLNEKGQSPLHLACINGHPKMIEFLLKKGIENHPHSRNHRMLLAKDFNCYSPLECILSRLFEEDTFKEQKAYWDCLNICIKYVDPLAVLALTIGLVPSQGIKKFFTTIYEDICNDLIAPTILIVTEKATPADPIIYSTVNELKGNRNASAENFRETMRVLVDLYLQKRPLISTTSNISDTFQFKPLHHAVKRGLNWSQGLSEVVRLDRLALIDPDQESDLLPFMIAANQCDVETINALIHDTVSLNGGIIDSSTHLECDNALPLVG
jgi:hypothetical protein